MEEVDTQLTSKSTDLKQYADTVTPSMGCCQSKSVRYNMESGEVNGQLDNGDTGNADVESERTKEERQIQKSSGGSDDTQKIEESLKDVHCSPVVTEMGDATQQALQTLRNAQTNDDYDEEDTLYDEAYNKYVYFWKSQSIYSQWHMSDFYIDGTKFTCAEQYMMYGKAKLFRDDDTAKLILKTSNPRKIKQLGREVQGFIDEIWKYKCLDIVKQGNIAKFSNSKFQKEIFSTHPKLLVEASPYDTIWGIGLEENDPCAWDESKWCGTNYLGYILTEVRNDLMIEHGWLTKEDKKNYVEKAKEKYRKPYESMLKILHFSKKTPPLEENRESSSKKNNTAMKHNENTSKASMKRNDQSCSSSLHSENLKKGNKSYKNKNNEVLSKSLNQDVTNDVKGASICTSIEEQATDKHLSEGDKAEVGTGWKIVGSNKAHQSNKHNSPVQGNQERPQTASGKKNKKKRKKKNGQEDRPDETSSRSCDESSSISSYEIKAEQKDKLKESNDFEPHIPNSSPEIKHQASVIHTDRNASSRSPSEKDLKNPECKELSRRQKKNAKRREQTKEEPK